MRSLLSDILVVTIGAGIIAFFSFFYYKEVTTRVQAGSGEVIGTLTYKRKTAERKYGGQMIWENIDRDIPLYNMDSIRTADQSEAFLRLNDGTEIKLNENSMIILSMGKDQIDLEFAAGSISAGRADVQGDIKKLNIKAGGTSISIEKSDLNLSQSRAGNLNVSVNKGDAKVDTGKSTATIGTDQQAVIGKESGEAKTLEHGIRLLSPAPDSYLVSSTGRIKAGFSWGKVSPGNSVFFELSGNDAFTDIIQKKEIRKGTAVYSEINKGIYYWRIRAVNRKTKKQEYSESRRLSILWDEPVILISPANKQEIAYRKSPPVIEFKWSKSEIASGYRFLLSGNPSLENPLYSSELPRNNIVLDSLGKGNYYWRVEKITGMDDISKTDPSAVYSFSITERETVAAPELMYPADKKRFSRLLLSRENIAFTWSGNPEISGYDLYVARDAEFRNIVFSSASGTNFMHFDKDLPKGDYFWRVAGRLDAKSPAVMSNIRSFSVVDSEEVRITLIAPAMNANIVPDDEKTAAVGFAWRASGDIRGTYKVRVSGDENFSSVYKESFQPHTAKGVTLEIEPGKYFWDVSITEEEGSNPVKSAAGSFIVEEMLGRPIVISPSAGLPVDMSDKNLLSLNWGAVEGASYYRIALYKRTAGKEYKIAESKETGTSYKITDLQKLDVGIFNWTIQAFKIRKDGEGSLIKSPVVKSDFIITLGNGRGRVNLKSLKIENL